MPRLRKLLAALTALGAMNAADALPGEHPIALVLASTAPGHAAGQVLDQGPIDIPDGASVTFLVATGRTVTVDGPFSGPLPPPSASADRAVGLFAGSRDHSEMGGTRSAAGNGEPLPAIDPAAGGIWCVMAGQPPALARPADPAFHVMLLQDPPQPELRLAWSEQDKELAWPAGLPVRDGRLTVTSLATGEQRSLELRLLPVARNEPARAVALAEAGCARQAASLIERLRPSMAPLSVFLTSDRGRYPSYHATEPIRFELRISHDAYVHCLLRDTDGEVRPVFRADLAVRAADPAQPLPQDGASAAASFRALPELDGAELRCIATERDLGAELPELGVGAGPAPLRAATLAALEDLLADPGWGRWASSQIILRVMP
ncbi:hypothetical protein [Geminicoccus roseus]|uniref:hypothetical protein n=1 Tax=Geminicoccus roseus TaxID=404900 RepID=UPI0012F8C6E1|nr:hypothetical protein [Geminicoccus roseus]